MLRSFKSQPDEVMNLSNCQFFGYYQLQNHYFKDLNYKADMGDHFDKNEKKTPGGATVAKYSKQILKLIYLLYLNAPRGARGVKRTERT
jgi:hypothetical protein